MPINRLSFLCMLLAGVLMSGTCAAQIFPRLEKQDVKKRIASGGKQPDETVAPEDPEPEVDVVIDGKKVLARYNELLAQYTKEERAQKKAMTKHTDELHISVRTYIEGVFLMRLGQYKDAERKLKEVDVNVKRENDISTPELLKAAEDIKAGYSYYQRMIAVVMQHWDDFENQDEANEAWKKASKKAIDIRTDLEKKIKRGSASSDSDVVGRMTGWLLTAKRHWINSWKYEQNIKLHPESTFSWQFFIASTGSVRNELKEEFTPHYLKQRAALVVMKEFFKHTPYVKGGKCDVTLALNHLGTGQLDGTDPYLESQPYHSFLGRALLKKAKETAGEYRETIEALQNK